MRKPVTFRFDSELLERARQRASADNRSLTNYVETAVLRALGNEEDLQSATVVRQEPKQIQGNQDQ